MLTAALGQTARHRDLEPIRIERRDLRPDDVDVRVQFCGICHTDLHAVRDADRTDFPLVPGHEFVGEVIAVGADVQEFAVGDPVAVGNIVDSCGQCAMCVVGQENFCARFPTLTYDGVDCGDGTRTLGAFAGRYVVDRRFVYHRPPQLDPAAVAPLMCAGVTVWEPLRQMRVGPGWRVGVVGLGGLGHLAVRLAHTLGADVTVFTTTAAKADDARRLGADRTVVSTDAGAMQSAVGSLDVVLDTVSVAHDPSDYLPTLDIDGTLFLLGYLGDLTVAATDLLVGRKRLTSAGSGGRRGTQDLLDFCGEHEITADVETLPAQSVNTGLDRLARGDVRYRFVLDLRGIDEAHSGLIGDE